MLVMAPFGAFFLFFGLVAIALDPDNLTSWSAPFYLAPIFCGLFFLTPAMFAFLRKRAEPVAVGAQTAHNSRASETPQAQPLGRTTENMVMGLFGSIAFIMGVIGLLIVIVVVFVLSVILRWISENGLPFPSGF